MVIEFKNRNPRNPEDKPLRILLIGETYRAYEQLDGSILLNDEKVGESFYPQETYNEFRKQFNLDWKSQLYTSIQGSSNACDIKS